jgi:hypothetical protein
VPLLTLGADTQCMSDDATNDGWIQLLAEMDAMAEKLAAEDWETLTVPAGDAAAVTADTGQTDRHGYAYVVPGDAAERFEALFVPDGFPRTEVYRATRGGHLFLLTVFLNPPTGAAVLLAGVLELDTLGGCRRAAEETGVMYSHVLRLDGTHLGSFEHDDPAPFFPDR